MTSGRDQVWMPGSIGVVDAMVRPGSPSISAEATLVYLCLFSYWGTNGECYPSVNTIAEGVHLHRTTVIRKLDELEAAGLITRDTSKGKSTYYRLTPPWEWSPPATGSAERLVAESDQSHKATSRAEQLHQSQGATTTGRTERPEVTHIRNPMKNPNEDDSDAEGGSADRHPAPDRTWREWYEKKTGGLLPRNQYSDVLDHAVTAGMEAALVILAIQRCLDGKKRVPLSFAATLVGNWRAAGILTVAALKEHEGDEEQEVTGGERRGDQPGGGTAAADSATSGIGAKPGRRYPYGAGRNLPGRRALRRPEPAGAIGAETSKWVLPEHRSGD